jgi:hypothetical protein
MSASGILRGDASASSPVTALAALDAYLVRAALSTPEYRADLKPGGERADVPLGRIYGVGPMMGPFTYRPKTYEELLPEQRMELVRSAGFRTFLLSSREQADAGGLMDPPDLLPKASRSQGPGFTPSPNASPSLKFTVTPLEMLLDRPVFVMLPAS